MDWSIEREQRAGGAATSWSWQKKGCGKAGGEGEGFSQLNSSLRHAQQQQDPVGHQQQQKLREQHTVAATYVYLPIQAVGMYYMHDA